MKVYPHGRIKLSQRGIPHFTYELDEYKGYTASVTYSAEREAYIGYVRGIRDMVYFEGATLEEAQHAFTEMVDEYLRLCTFYGREAGEVARELPQKWGVIQSGTMVYELDEDYGWVPRSNQPNAKIRNEKYLYYHGFTVLAEEINGEKVTYATYSLEGEQ